MGSKPKYVHETTARGKTYYYYRRGKVNVRIKEVFGTAAFYQRYAQIHASYDGKVTGGQPGTVDYLCEKYIASPDYNQLSAASKKNIGPRIDKFRRAHGKRRIEEIRVPFVRALQAELQATPGKANAYTSLISRLLNFAAAEEMIPFNPIAKKIKPLRMGKGHQPWPEHVMERFLKTAGRTPKLAFMLGLYTGQREADIVKMRWSDIQDGMVRVIPQKTENSTATELYIPIHPKLAAALEEAKRASNGLTILQQRNGRPYTLNGFKTVWHEDKGRQPGYVFHGLRKNATVALFECGCTVQEVQAITGHATMAMVQHYGKGANQKRLANAAMEKWAASGQQQPSKPQKS